MADNPLSICGTNINLMPLYDAPDATSLPSNVIETPVSVLEPGNSSGSGDLEMPSYQASTTLLTEAAAAARPATRRPRCQLETSIIESSSQSSETAGSLMAGAKMPQPDEALHASNAITANQSITYADALKSTAILHDASHDRTMPTLPSHAEEMRSKPSANGMDGSRPRLHISTNFPSPSLKRIPDSSHLTKVMDEGRSKTLQKDIPPRPPTESKRFPVTVSPTDRLFSAGSRTKARVVIPGTASGNMETALSSSELAKTQTNGQRIPPKPKASDSLAMSPASAEVLVDAVTVQSMSPDEEDYVLVPHLLRTTMPESSSTSVPKVDATEEDVADVGQIAQSSDETPHRDRTRSPELKSNTQSIPDVATTLPQLEVTSGRTWSSVVAAAVRPASSPARRSAAQIASNQWPALGVASRVGTSLLDLCLLCLIDILTSFLS